MLHRPIPTLLNHCVEGVRGNVPKFGHFLANLAVFGPLGHFLANLATLALFGNVWDFPNFGQILRDFAGTFGPLAKCPLAEFGFFGHLGTFWQFWWILGKFGGCGI